MPSWQFVYFRDIQAEIGHVRTLWRKSSTNKLHSTVLACVSVHLSNCSKRANVGWLSFSLTGPRPGCVRVCVCISHCLWVVCKMYCLLCSVYYLCLVCIVYFLRVLSVCMLCIFYFFWESPTTGIPCMSRHKWPSYSDSIIHHFIKRMKYRIIRQSAFSCIFLARCTLG